MTSGRTDRSELDLHVDLRLPDSIIRMLRSLPDVKVEGELLHVGDVWCGTVVFMRRTPERFIDHIKRKQMFEDIDVLKQTFRHVYILIEGRVGDLFGKGLPVESVFGAVASCCARGAHVMWVEEYGYFVKLLISLSRKHNDGKRRAGAETKKMNPDSGVDEDELRPIAL